MIKSIIFDWGGVLIDNPSPGLLAYFAKYFNISKERFNSIHKKYETSFQKGTISEDMYWEKLCSDLSVKIPNEKSLWKEAFSGVYNEKKDIFSLASSLKKNGYKTGLLSNTEVPAMNFFYEQEYKMFNVLVFSCKEGFRKPEKKIYEITLEQLNVQPEETLFIDDNKKYIRGAETLGIQTILFRNSKQLRETLASFSLKI